MKPNELIQRYLHGEATDAEVAELDRLLASDKALRRKLIVETGIDAGLCEIARERASQPSVVAPRRSVWLSWRPLTAAAAGIVFGMFCTSVVFGFVAQRAVKRTPVPVFDPGVENGEAIMDQGVPHGVGQWGADSAKVMGAENGVEPLEGQRMMRLEPIPREKNVKNLASRVYQVLDLRSLPMPDISSDAEVQVSASFCATNSDVSSRYLIRAIALDEPPEQATIDFWSKMESDGVVSESQRFDTKPGARGWQTFSLKLRLPPESKTLVFILGAVPPEDPSKEASIHYMDEVQVSLLTPESTLP